MDLSIQRYVADKQSQGGDEDFLARLNRTEDEDEEQIDKITPLAFTEVMMRNQVGGFGTATLFSDLRYTLPPL